jgi:hypothetical protein
MEYGSNGEVKADILIVEYFIIPSAYVAILQASKSQLGRNEKKN